MSGVYNYILSFFVNTEDPQSSPKIEIRQIKIDDVITPMAFNISRDTELIKELKQNKLFLKLQLQYKNE
jgi:hypothetical protein